MNDRILGEITRFVQTLGGPQRQGPATFLYNEGWLLRLVLGAAGRGVECLPDPFEPGAEWFSEARLYTPFAARTRGDRLAESVTHADGAIGHFAVGRSSRAGLHVAADATQFVICEAKLFSGLSSGTTRARGYDQAARNVACLAWALKVADRPPASFRSLAFWVLAPQAQLRTNMFGCVTRGSIEQKIRERIRGYEAEWRETTLDPWVEQWLLPVLDKIHIECVPWEQVVERIIASEPEFGAGLQEFYHQCLVFNRGPAPRADVVAEEPREL